MRRCARLCVLSLGHRAGSLADVGRLGQPARCALSRSSPRLVETVQRRGAAVRRGFVAHGPPRWRGGRQPHGCRRPGLPSRATGLSVPGRPVVVAPGWRRPAAYWWRPGAAVAAGAAVGFVTAPPRPPT